MGLIYADIEIINGEGFVLAGKNIIGTEEIRRIHVSALVDSGSYMLAINENIQEYLQLPVIERRRGQLADGTFAEYDIVAPIELRFKSRQTTCRAYVLPGDAEVLLGSIPMEDMDVLIHLIVHPDHPYLAQMRL